MLNASGIERQLCDSRGSRQRMHPKGWRKLLASFPRENYERLNVNRPISLRIDRINANNPHAMADRRSPRPIVARRGRCGPDAHQRVDVRESPPSPRARPVRP
ncbi:hypothetical protein [Burkholderia sp. AW49-1]